MINIQAPRFLSPVAIFLLCSGFAVFLLTGCGQTRHEKALETARTLMSTGGLADTEAVRYLETSDQLLERLAGVKIRAGQNRLYVLENMTEKYEALRMWPEAAEAVDKLTRLQPTEIRWRLAEGRIHSQWSQVNPSHVETAREAFQTALELDAESLEARYGLGILLAFRSDNQREGRRFLSGVANHSPINVNNREIIKQARFALGRFQFEQGKLGGATETFRQLTKMGSISSESTFMAHRNLGRTYLRMGDQDRAREQFRQAYNIRPSDGEVRRKLRELGVDVSDRYSRFD